MSNQPPVTALEPLPGGKNYRQATWLFRILQWLLRLILHSLFVIEVKGLENIPRQGGYIFAGNHLCWIDPFLMLIGAPATPRIYFIADRFNMENPPWRKFFTQRIGGIIPVEYNQRNSMRDLQRQVGAVLAGGGVLGIFPEGDVSAIETGRLLPLKNGIGYFASQTGAAIVPVSFSGTKELWLRKHLRMTVGQPIPGRQGAKAVALAQTEAVAVALLANMPPMSPENPRSRKLFKKFFTDLFTVDEREHPVPE